MQFTVNLFEILGDNRIYCGVVVVVVFVVVGYVAWCLARLVNLKATHILRLHNSP